MATKKQKILDYIHVSILLLICMLLLAGIVSIFTGSISLNYRVNNDYNHIDNSKIQEIERLVSENNNDYNYIDNSKIQEIERLVSENNKDTLSRFDWVWYRIDQLDEKINRNKIQLVLPKGTERINCYGDY